VALAALAIRTAATIYHRDYPVIGDALTFHLEGGHLAHGEGFRRVFEDVPTFFGRLNQHFDSLTDLLLARELAEHRRPQRDFEGWIGWRRNHRRIVT